MAEQDRNSRARDLVNRAKIQQDAYDKAVCFHSTGRLGTNRTLDKDDLVTFGNRNNHTSKVFSTLQVRAIHPDLFIFAFLGHDCFQP